MSNRIAEFRKAKRLTQQALADAMGLHSSVGWQSVHRWEHGKSWPSHANFKALAAALGCRPYELIMEPEDIAAQSADPSVALYERIMSRAA